MFKKNKILISLFSFLLCVSVLTGCGKNGSNSGTNTATGTNTSIGSENNEVISPQELEKNLKTSGAVTKKGELVVMVTNNNKVTVDLEIEAEFYDSNGNLVGSSDGTLEGVGKKSEIAVEFYDTPKLFDNYKIYVDVAQSEYKSYVDKISINHNNTGEQIAVQVTNNSEEEIEYMSVAVVYYQGDTVVGYQDDFEYGIKAGRSGNFDVSYDYDRNYDDVRFDSYKVFVNQAASNNW